MSANFQQLANFIWSVADLLRGPYRPPQYERVMLPLTVLRRFDAVLASSKEAVLKRHAELSSKGIANIDAILNNLAKDEDGTPLRADLAGACIGAVNWCEVAHKASRKGLDVLRVRSLMQDLEVSIIPFSQEQAELAANLWSITASHGLSLADRACLALATERQLPILTADRAWSELRLDLDIQLIR